MNPDPASVDPREVPEHLRSVVGDARVYTVTDLYQGRNGIMQRVRGWGSPWTVGEITDLKERNGGHLAFGLRDEGARLDCFVHARLKDRLRFSLENGLAVIAKITFDVYPQGGRIQARIEDLLPRDKGPRQLAYEQTLAKLTAEGLLDRPRKPLPRFPRSVGIVTSSRGKAIDDLITNMLRRWSRLHIRVWSVSVQGDDAVRDMVGAIRGFNKHLADTDVLVVGRGGGSLDDLWTFNDEELARAICGSSIPIVVSLGHTTDRCIAGMVADRDAPTPSTAAEMITSIEEISVLQRLAELERRMRGDVERHQRDLRRRVESLENRRVFRDPAALMERAGQRLSHASLRLPAAGRTLVAETRGRVDEAARTVALSMKERLRDGKEDFNSARIRLHSASPLALLERGYSVAERADDRRTIRGPQDVAAGDRIRLRTHGGDISCEVGS